MMIKVSVPATSANLGAGFDCMGWAINLRNEIELEETDSGVEIIQSGCYYRNIPTEQNLIWKAAKRVFEESGKMPKGVKIKINTSIPSTRGLGSSAACIVGGMVAANAVYGLLGPKEILELASGMEGHPDNVVPCLTGGLATSYYDGEKLTYNAMKIRDDIKLLVFWPDAPLQTRKSRRVIPETVSLKDAAFNTAHSALFVSAIATGKYGLLKEAVSDRLHQPYRKEFIKDMDDLFKLCYDNGAYGCYISGSGPSVAAIIPSDREEKIKNDVATLKEGIYNFDVYNFDNLGTYVTKS